MHDPPHKLRPRKQPASRDRDDVLGFLLYRFGVRLLAHVNSRLLTAYHSPFRFLLPGVLVCLFVCLPSGSRHERGETCAD